jgi:type IV fimbrial biogenesis protein FimT
MLEQGGSMSRNSHGLTLLEALFTLLILSVLIAIALPSFSAMIAAKKSDLMMGRLQQAVELGKVAAITSAGDVTLCKSESGKACDGNWQDGVIVFTDKNSDRHLDKEDRLIRYITFPDIDGTLRWRAFQNRQYLQFTPQGFTRYQNGSFVFCPRNNKAQFARQLVINRTARARITIDSDGDGIREDSTGAPIRC